MSTNNMAASWRQANDVIAPGWVYRQNVTCLKRFTRYGRYAGEEEDVIIGSLADVS